MRTQIAIIGSGSSGLFNSFDQKIQAAELDCLFRSRAAATAFTENYVGLPFF